MCCQDPETEFTDRDHRDGDALGWATGERPVLLDCHEKRRVGKCLFGAHLVGASGHAIGRSSVVPGNRSGSSLVSPGSARQRSLPWMKAAQGSDRGRFGKGTSSATGRPLTVTSRRSPASTRRSTALTSLRNSRAGTSVMKRV